MDFLPWRLKRESICLQCGRPGFNPWVRKIHWRRKWQCTPVLLPGKSHGQRSLVGPSPWGHKESDTTERLHFHFRFQLELVQTPQVKGSVPQACLLPTSNTSHKWWLPMSPITCKTRSRRILSTGASVLMESRFTLLLSHGCFLFTNPEVCQTLSFGVFTEDFLKN